MNIKRLALALILCLCCLQSEARMSTMVVSGSVPTGGITWIHDLKMNENAANTTVTNYGTSSTAWVASENTADFHSATTDPGGDGSFLCIGGERISTSEAWTAEKFEALIWYAPDDAVPGHEENIFTNGNHDGAINANEWIMVRYAASDEIQIMAQGNTGSYGSRTTTDFAPSSDTFYLLKFTVDASVSPWNISLAYSTDGTNFTTLTLGAWVNNSGDVQIAVFNSGLQLGHGTYQSECYFGRFKMRSTE